MSSDVKEAVRSFIIDDLEWGGARERLGDGVSLIDEGVLDSLNLLEVVHFIRDRYGIRIDDADVVPTNFETLDEIERFVASRRSPGRYEAAR